MLCKNVKRELRITFYVFTFHDPPTHSADVFDERCSMRLSALLTALPHVSAWGEVDVSIKAIACDSRRVVPGCLFVAYRGVAVDGHDYIPQALSRGAVAVVAEKELGELKGQVPHVVVPDGREALAYLSAAWQGFPSQRLIVVGVTGTDGKTTTCNLVHSMVAAAGRRAGLVTTVNAVIGERVMDTGLHTTTPDAPDVQRYLAEMLAAGMEMAVLEATSEGLAQHRVSACDFDVAVVTNITHDHLYYHGSYEQYRADKARLFRSLTAAHRKPDVPKVAILNADDSSYGYLRRISADRQISYALHRGADVTAKSIEFGPQLTRFAVQTPAGDFEVQTRLVGEFNVCNILAAAAVGLSQGVDGEDIQAGISAMTGVVGRMERIDEGQDFSAIVDFAHTPNALQNTLRTLRPMTPGRLIVVFGCAGLRDVEKRPQMGQIAARLADVTVITAEDPRTESLEAIMEQIAAGAAKAGAREGADYYRIGDRAEAIAFAVNLARPGDTLVITGKGHERSMCYGTVEYPWSDHDVLRSALRGEPRVTQVHQSRE
jgi:UDP-N-acetylmuramoyl-L-alanyl-D-glutamate--2,6-diaminopimelate ligase